MRPQLDAPGYNFHELFKKTVGSSLKWIFRHFFHFYYLHELAASLCCSLLSVILVMICIPVALAWSGLVPIDATCQACWVGLDWAALLFFFSLSPFLLHLASGRWFLSLSYIHFFGFPKPFPTFKTTSVFFISPNGGLMWEASFPPTMTGYLTLSLHTPAC